MGGKGRGAGPEAVKEDRVMGRDLREEGRGLRMEGRTGPGGGAGGRNRFGSEEEVRIWGGA